jgi:hypothetical protein
MTEIAVHQPAAAVAVPDRQPNFSTDLVFWAQQAEAAAVYAERVCNTSMVPAAYRGKPAEAAAAILAGTELGFSPIRSLNAFDNIQGTPAPKAITLRALVLGQGHKVIVLEQSPTKAVVTGLRKGDNPGERPGDPAGDWQTSTWDLERAQKLPQYKTNPNYKTNLEAMLIARATAEVCRWVGSDAIMGIPYAAEEMDFQPVAAPAVRRLTAADLDAPAAIEAAPVEMVSREQQKAMFALWADLGYGTDADRITRLDLTARFIGVPVVGSSNDLTAEQADTVIARLRERKAAMTPAEAEPDGGDR